MMSIIRPEKTDIHTIFEIFQECRFDLDAQGIKQWDDIYPNKEVIEEDIQNQSIFILKHDEEIAGVVSYDEMEIEEYKSVDWKHKDGRNIVIHRLSIRPKYQGQGIAKKLIQFVHGKSRQELYTSVRLDVYSDNQRAIDFYKKLGYELRGEVWFPRRSLPFYCMEKNLSEKIR
ncbi:GNAT family N-acetyltransferase [Paenibacillus sp. DS2015]|uniref:GNAT family N-acetyltransferase n=1 Tax=Paenibacillus sp. DS2015 TaxID=3373917 RepID=UPI003D1D438F